MKILKKKSNEMQRGQILLITIMLIATAVTVVLTTAFTGQTDTKLAKLEADQQKALAAAEAGVEAALKSGDTVDIGGLIGNGISGSTTISATGADPTYVTPSSVNASGEYTYYVADYNTSTGEFTNPLTSNLKIYYGTESGVDCNSDIALDISLISGDPAVVKKFVSVNASSPAALNDIATSIPATGHSIGSPATTFFCGTSDINLGSSLDSKLLIVRVLKQNTKIVFESTTAGVALKVQGRTVTSEAKTSTGASRKVQLFQSYPQIPAEFFVTSF